jgi:hypothetical protein
MMTSSEHEAAPDSGSDRHGRRDQDRVPHPANRRDNRCNFKFDQNLCMIATKLESAIFYVLQEWPVIPLRPGTKLPALRSAHSPGDAMFGVCKGECGKLGHGFRDGTLSLTQVLAWWTEEPDYNIGICTGTKHGIDVLDMDTPSYAQGKSELPKLDNGIGPSVETPNGWHHYFEPTGLGRLIRFTDHNDWLGRDGYVVAPPSTLDDGGKYRWCTPHSLPPRPIPDELLAFITNRSSRTVPSTERRAYSSDLIPGLRSVRSPRYSADGLVQAVRTASEGNRNHKLNWAAYRLGSDIGHQKLSNQEAHDAADALLEAAISVGLPQREASSTIRSGVAAGIVTRE